MRRALDYLRRARPGTAARPDQSHEPSSARGWKWTFAGCGCASAPVLAAAVGAAPAGLSTTRTDLTPKDLARVEAITKPTNDFSKPEQFELMQGGAGTSKKRPNQDAFSQFSANITFEEEGTFKLGNALFRKLWVSSPSSTQASDGLGPLFNARACQSCHLKDGRGHPPEGNPDATSMFLRLGPRGRDGGGEAGGRRPCRAQLPRSCLWRAVAGPRRARPGRRGAHGHHL